MNRCQPSTQHVGGRNSCVVCGVNVRVFACMYVHMYVCMYVYLYTDKFAPGMSRGRSYSRICCDSCTTIPGRTQFTFTLRCEGTCVSVCVLTNFYGILRRYLCAFDTVCASVCVRALAHARRVQGCCSFLPHCAGKASMCYTSCCSAIERH